MFLALANNLAADLKRTKDTKNPDYPARRVLRLDASAASVLMEAAWSRGGPGLLFGVPALNVTSVGTAATNIGFTEFYSSVWDHLIYAYMIENTRAYEIMGRVIAEFTQGERLGIPQRNDSFQWLRTTEELFYKDASPFQPFNLVSRIRPDVAATRRNAYYRMFGMDLNHGRDGQPSYPYVKAEAANRDFVVTFEEFLREVWRAIENAANSAGANPTDFAAIGDLAVRLQDMLNARRGGDFVDPNLAREEFLAVCLAAWLHLTVSFDSPIVEELLATGPSPEERLRHIGERVGLPAHSRSHSYFILARRLSTLLVEIERGDYSDSDGAETLAGGGEVQRALTEVIFHWSLISGRDMKAGRTAISPSYATGRTTSAVPGQAIGASSGGLVAVGATGGDGKVPVGSS
jgi:hypothetical protein